MSSNVPDQVHLPDEIWLYVFLDIPESMLPKCGVVCKLWNRLVGDHTLIYYFREKNVPLTEKMIKSCERGSLFSFLISVKDYCGMPDIKLSFFDNFDSHGAGTGTHDLWVRCMIAASSGGHVSILKKILGYGPSYGFKKAKEVAQLNGHWGCVEILEDEGIMV